MPKKHDLKQIESWAKDWGIYKWMNANNPDNEKFIAKKPYKPKTSGFKGKKPDSKYKK